MKLSIVVPVYNMELYLEKCLTSIVSQPSTPIDSYEVIVVNDGSTDASMNVVNAFNWHGVNHSIYEKENGGLSSARNYGFNHARGEYVWFVDSDDWIDTDCVAKIIPYLNGVDAIQFSSFYSSTEKSDTVFSKTMSAKTGVELTASEYYFPVPFSVYKTQFLHDNSLSFQHGILMEDLHFTPRAMYKAASIHIIDFPVYHYFQRYGSIMKCNVTMKRIEDRIWISCDLFRFMHENVKPEHQKDWSECIITDVNAIMYDACRSEDKEILERVRAYIKSNTHLTNLLRHSHNKRNVLWFYLGKLLFGDFYSVYRILYKIRY